MKLEQRKPVVVAIVGYKNTGKTTLVCRLTQALTEKGYRVGTLKHDHGDFSWDYPDTDTFAHRQAGAAQTAIVSPHKWGVLRWDSGQRDLDFDMEPPNKLLELFGEMDIVLVEGYKYSTYPKLVLHGDGTILQDTRVSHIRAVITDAASSVHDLPASLPQFDRNDIQGIIPILFWEK